MAIGTVIISIFEYLIAKSTLPGNEVNVIGHLYPISGYFDNNYVGQYRDKMGKTQLYRCLKVLLIQKLKCFSAYEQNQCLNQNFPVFTLIFPIIRVLFSEKMTLSNSAIPMRLKIISRLKNNIEVKKQYRLNLNNLTSKHNKTGETT